MGIEDSAHPEAPLIAHLLLIWESPCNSNWKRSIRVACTALGLLAQRSHRLTGASHLSLGGYFFFNHDN